MEGAEAGEAAEPRNAQDRPRTNNGLAQNASRALAVSARRSPGMKKPAGPGPDVSGTQSAYGSARDALEPHPVATAGAPGTNVPGGGMARSS